MRRFVPPGAEKQKKADLRKVKQISSVDDRMLTYRISQEVLERLEP